MTRDSEACDRHADGRNQQKAATDTRAVSDLITEFQDAAGRKMLAAFEEQSKMNIERPGTIPLSRSRARFCFTWHDHCSSAASRGLNFRSPRDQLGVGLVATPTLR